MLSHIIFIIALLLLDLGLFYLTRSAFDQFPNKSRKWLIIFFWASSAYVWCCFWFLQEIFMDIPSKTIRRSIIASIFFIESGKVLWAIYWIIAGVLRKGLTPTKSSPSPPDKDPNSASSKFDRRKFISQAAIMGASIPAAIGGFSIINRAHEYQLHRRRILLPKLPRAFDGITIGQISDIHAGSFYNKNAVRGGVDLLMGEKPDLIFFTGDLVNRDTEESLEYIPLFSQVQAPMGVFSVLGNHDYGDYRSWPSVEAKLQNLQQMKEVHGRLGWKLLCNENHLLNIGSDGLAILGVENWGVRRFSKYGNLQQAHAGTEDAPVKILLSHDPSHWEAQVWQYPDIDITFSGHTHGFQFGFEIGEFSWSPAQYLYKQWAGLYEHLGQYIYVNRGYGFIGLPGRIGINPEITIVELVRA